jgi:hypothetical protein
MANYVFDHPWRVFGPLAAALVAYLVRSSIGTSRQDALVRTLDDASPLHAREATCLGRANGLSADEWRAVVTDVIAVVEARCVAAAAASPNAPLFDYAEAARVRPSDVEAAVFSAKPACRLAHGHMLRRAAAWLAAKECGRVRWPADDAEAFSILAARAREDAEAEGRAEVAPEGVTGAVMSLLRGIGRTAGLLPPPPPLAAPGGVREALAPAGDDLQDRPLPLLTALSLYGTLVGARNEWDPDTPEADAAASGAPRPSERFVLWVDMIRAEAALRSRLSSRLGRSLSAAATDDAASVGADGDDAALLADGAMAISQAGLAGEAACAPCVTLNEAAAVVRLLNETFQLPSRVRTGKSVSWPLPHYKLRSASDAVTDACKDAKIEFSSTPTPAKPPPPVGGAAPVPAKPSVPLAPGSPRKWLSRSEARTAFLESRSLCAWGECMAHVPEYKGGLF